MSFYLTTAIDYVNSRPHLGTAYEKVTADVVARYKRLTGVPTRFVMGNDEHSQNVFRKARELGLDAHAYCDQMELAFREVWAKLSISFDDFIRTTEPRHRAAVQRMAQECHDRGDVYEGHYEGWYCVSCEAFKQEKDLVDGNCPIHLTRPDWIREKNYFFRLSKYQQPLLDHYAAHPEFIQPDVRRNEILRLVESGLDDISISRAGQSWGIPLPFDPSSVVYVWFDALINYAAAVGYGTDDALFGRWWPASLHVVGKDITRFHCVVWPAMLMSAGLPLPSTVFGHGWVHFKGQKMSKSLGTVIDPLDAADRLGADPLRLYLVKEIPYGGDGDFSWERFEERYNVDLANNLGNLVSRVTAMVDKYRGLSLPAAPLEPGRLREAAGQAVETYRDAMERLALHEAAMGAFSLVDATNGFITASEPWTLAKDPARAEALTQVLCDVAEALRIAAVLLLPVMPTAAAEMLRRAGEPTPADALTFDRDTAWSTLARTLVKGPALWPRLESSNAATTAAGVETVPDPIIPPATPPAATSEPSAPPAPSSQGDGAAAVAAAPADSRIGIDQFMSVELRVAKVLAADRVPKSKKLMQLRIDAGAEERTIVAGIAEAYEPETLVGRLIVIVANLKPAKLMGIESNGMVLASSSEGGKPILVAPGEGAVPGDRVPMIDTHCHLADEIFEPDLDAVIDRARGAGLTSAICILAAGDDGEARRADRVRALWPEAGFAIGVHPHQAHQCAGQPGRAESWVRKGASNGRVCAVGEIGLDYHYDFSPRDVQQGVFVEQLACARVLALPVVIHTREADEDTFAILAADGAGVPGVFHCFTGGVERARRALDLGFHLSLAGIVTFPRATDLHEVAAFVPEDRLLIETDSPFLAPVPYRGKRNEPAWVAEVADRVATLRGLSRAAVLERTTANALQLFGAQALARVDTPRASML